MKNTESMNLNEDISSLPNISKFFRESNEVKKIYIEMKREVKSLYEQVNYQFKSTI